MRGFTPLPETPGAVSTWATQPMTGTSPSTLDGMEAYTMPEASSSSACAPISFSSPASIRASSVWPGVDGTLRESASDWESTETYFKKRSKTEIFMRKIKD